jgi:hypothetical protein
MVIAAIVDLRSSVTALSTFLAETASLVGQISARHFSRRRLCRAGSFDLYDAEGVRRRPRAFIDRHRARRRSYMASRNSLRDKLREPTYTSPAIGVEAHRLVFPQETFGFTLLT